MKTLKEQNLQKNNVIALKDRQLQQLQELCRRLKNQGPVEDAKVDIDSAVNAETTGSDLSKTSNQDEETKVPAEEAKTE